MDGVDDRTYTDLFETVIGQVMDFYRPSVIVFQSGADSLQCDRLGCFNLTLKGHAKCLQFVKKYGLPMLVLGGGGYTIKNVSRCWTYETSVCLDVKIDNDLPLNDYLAYFGPDFRLHPPNNPCFQNQNTKKDIEMIKMTIAENLRALAHAPCVQMNELPPDSMLDAFDDEWEPDMDVRLNERDTDDMVDHDAELYEGDNDNEGE